MLWVLVLVGQLWFSVPDYGTILSGSWQSCKQEDGTYAARIYDHCVLGKCDWSLELGPYDSFGLWAYSSDLDPDPADPSNLLKGDYEVKGGDNRAKRRWVVKKFNIVVEVVAAGGSREDCESFFVTVRKLKVK